MRWFCLAFLLSSCSMYQSTFDCPPKRGVGCKSVTEIEEMITERDEGPDLFMAENIHGARCDDCRGSARSIRVNDKGDMLIRGKEKPKRIWVNGETTRQGNRVAGHYVYFELTDLDEWTVIPGNKSGDEAHEPS